MVVAGGGSCITSKGDGSWTTPEANQHDQRASREIGVGSWEDRRTLLLGHLRHPGKSSILSHHRDRNLHDNKPVIALSTTGMTVPLPVYICNMQYSLVVQGFKSHFHIIWWVQVPVFESLLSICQRHPVKLYLAVHFTWYVCSRSWKIRILYCERGLDRYYYNYYFLLYICKGDIVIWQQHRVLCFFDVQLDPAGWMPKFFVNRLNTKLVMIIEKLQKLAQEMWEIWCMGLFPVGIHVDQCVWGSTAEWQVDKW